MFNLFKKGSEDTATEETDGFDPDRVTVHYEGEVMSISIFSKKSIHLLKLCTDFVLDLIS